MTSEYRKAQMRAYANKRYAAMRLLSGGQVGTRFLSVGQLSRGEERRRFAQLRKIAVGKCEICELVCDEHTHVAFAFDHIDPATKVCNVSRMVYRKYTIQQISDEIDKCRVLCHCCHAFVTYLGDHHKDQDVRVILDHPQLFDYA